MRIMTLLCRLLPLALTFVGAADAADLLIENVTVVSAHLAGPSADQNVLIVDGRIAEISADTIYAAESTPRIDAQDLYLTPGIMDSHHHVSFVPGLGPMGFGLAAVHSELTDDYVRQQPRSLLYYGVTQVLDPAPMTAWRRFESQALRPDLFRCGAIPNPGGYPGAELPSGMAEALPYRIGTDSPEVVVERIANDGAICVKLFVEDGFGESTDWPLLEETLLDRVLQCSPDARLTRIRACERDRHVSDRARHESRHHGPRSLELAVAKRGTTCRVNTEQGA